MHNQPLAGCHRGGVIVQVDIQKWHFRDSSLSNYISLDSGRVGEGTHACETHRAGSGAMPPPCWLV